MKHSYTFETESAEELKKVIDKVTGDKNEESACRVLARVAELLDSARRGISKSGLSPERAWDRVSVEIATEINSALARLRSEKC